MSERKEDRERDPNNVVKVQRQNDEEKTDWLIIRDLIHECYFFEFEEEEGQGFSNKSCIRNKGWHCPGEEASRS